jgi:hypothetical protein
MCTGGGRNLGRPPIGRRGKSATWLAATVQFEPPMGGPDSIIALSKSLDPESVFFSSLWARHEQDIHQTVFSTKRFHKFTIIVCHHGVTS